MAQLLALILFSFIANGAYAQQTAIPSTLAGRIGATVLDSGVMVVTGNPLFAREENFEYLRRQDGGVTLLNTITATDGRFRVRARFDLDDQWRSLRASGVGLYDGVPVEIQMQRRGKRVEIKVRGEGMILNPKADCDPDCFINMSPSSLAMFVMTRHYEEAKGGEQTFHWTGQDLDRVRTLSGGKADLTFQGSKVYSRQTLPGRPPRQATVRHYTFVERLPSDNGGTFTLDFDLWTDGDHRPLGFRVRTPGTDSATVGFRKGWEGVRSQLLEGS